MSQRPEDQAWPGNASPDLAAGSEDEGECGATMMIQVPERPQPQAPRAARQEAHLVCLAGNDAGRIFPLRGATTLIGRGLNCTVILNDPSVSRRHFNIMQTPEGYKLIDLGSGNGTRVNGAHVQEIVLRDGHQIEAGITTLRFSMGPPGAAAPAPQPVVPQPAPQPVAPQPVAPAPQPVAPEPVMPAPQPVAPAPQPVVPEPASPYPDMEIVSPAGEPEMQVVSPGGVAPEDEMQVVSPGGVAPEDEMQVVSDYDQPVEYPVEEPSGGGPLKLIVIILAALVVGLGGFLAVDKFAGLGIIFGAKDKPAEVAAGDAQTLMDEGVAAAGERDWGGAIKKFKEAEKIDKELAGLRKELRKARAERDAADDLQTAMDAIEAKDVDNAKRALLLIPDDSVYYEEAQQLITTLDGATPKGGGEEQPKTAAGGDDPVKLYEAGNDEAATAALKKLSSESGNSPEAKEKFDKAVAAIAGIGDKMMRDPETMSDAKKLGAAKRVFRILAGALPEDHPQRQMAEGFLSIEIQE